MLKGFEKIKGEADETKSLNRAYIPMLQRISPGDLQHAENALEFARVLVADWLSTYKFRSWAQHRTHSPGSPVTDEEKRARAKKVASDLCDHARWLTHGRSIRLQDLRDLGVEVTDFGQEPRLAEAIRRYYVLLQMLFNTTNVYKVIETPKSQIMRFLQAPGGVPMPPRGVLESAVAELQCARCKKAYKVQMDFDKLKPLQSGTVRYPANDVLVCDQCGNQLNLAGIRQQAEMQFKRQVVRA